MPTSKLELARDGYDRVRDFLLRLQEAIARFSEKRPVAWRRICVTFWLVATLGIVNSLLSWVLVPFGGKTELVWHDYRELTSLDTVVVGSSFAQHSINPTALDPVLGSDSYNLGTPAQSLNNTCQALATAIEDWHVRRAILCLEYDTLFEDQWANAAIAFAKYKCEGEPLPQRLHDVAELVSSDFFFTRHYSLTCMFPWAYEHVPLTSEAISENISNRMLGNIHIAAKNYARITDGHVWDYDKKGFVGLKLDLKGQCNHGFDYSTFEGSQIVPTNLTYLQQICGLCAQNDVDLYVVAPPTAASTLIQYGEAYPSTMESIRQLVQNAGGTFLDLNLAKSSVLELDGTNICDLAHLSSAGANKTSRALGELIARKEAGESLDDLFFSYDSAGWSSYLASVQYVDSVDYAVVARGHDALVEATACTGSQSAVLYRFETKKTADGSWVVARDWSLSPSYEVPEGATKSIPIRVSAKTLQNERVVRWVTGSTTS